MKHFIGGMALGFFLAIIGSSKTPGTKNSDYVVAILVHIFIAVLVGVIAWGLLP